MTPRRHSQPDQPQQNELKDIETLRIGEVDRLQNNRTGLRSPFILPSLNFQQEPPSSTKYKYETLNNMSLDNTPHSQPKKQSLYTIQHYDHHHPPQLKHQPFFSMHTSVTNSINSYKQFAPSPVKSKYDMKAHKKKIRLINERMSLDFLQGKQNIIHQTLRNKQK